MPTAVPPWLEEDRRGLPPGSTDDHRVTWFIRVRDLPGYGALLRRAADEPDWFCPAAFAGLEIP